MNTTQGRIKRLFINLVSLENVTVLSESARSQDKTAKSFTPSSPVQSPDLDSPTNDTCVRSTQNCLMALVKQ
jgi:hypothetical protein